MQKIIDQLTVTRSAAITLDGSKIAIRALGDNAKIELVTSVYFGGNYIPKSVRDSLVQNPPFGAVVISTSLKIDEENFEIFLVHEGFAHEIAKPGFILVLEEFTWLAERWREHLDENDKKDLVYIHSS